MFRRRPQPSTTRRIRQLEEAMSDLSADQQHLNADVDRLGNVLADVRTEIDGLKAQIAAGTPAPALDFSVLDQKLTDAEAAFPPAPPAA